MTDLDEIGPLEQIASLEPSPKPFPGFLQALGLSALYVVVLAFLALPVVIIGVAFEKEGLYLHPIVQIVASLAAALVVVLMAKESTGTNLKQLFKAVPIKPFVLRWTAALTLSNLILGILFAFWMQRAFPDILPKPDYGFSQSRWIALILIVIIAPLCEEALFRGVLLKGFVGRYGVAPGVALSALFFATAHGSLARIPFTFCLGCILAWLYLRTGTLWVGIGAHAFNNLIAGIAILTSAKPAATPIVPPFHWAEILWAIVAVVLAFTAWINLRAIFDQSTGDSSLEPLHSPSAEPTALPPTQ